MTTEQFDKVLNSTLDKVQSVLGSKATEYARGDRLHNFKVAAALAGSTPEMALRGMMSKYVISIYDLIADVENGKCAKAEMWDEKIIDNINYLILLKAIVIERIEKEEAEKTKPIPCNSFPVPDSMRTCIHGRNPNICLDCDKANGILNP